MPQLSLDDNLRRDYEAGFQQAQSSADQEYFKRRFANPDNAAGGGASATGGNAAAQPPAAPPAGETPPGAAPEPGSAATTPAASPAVSRETLSPGTAGPLEPGNIDLKNRPRVKNPDGSISTVLSKSFNIDGQEVLLPTISPGGTHWTDEGAIAHFRATGQHLGKFATPADANAFAQTLHEQQAQMIAGDLSPGMADLKARMTAGAQTSVSAIAADVLKGGKEAVPQAIGGVMDALTNASNALESLVPLGEITTKGIVPTADFKAAGGTDIVDALTPGAAESTTGGIVRSTSTFLAGFLPALKATKLISAGSVALQSVEAGALASAVVLDPHEERLSTYLNTVPALAPLVPDYLADNNPAHESDWQGRLKNAIEGAGLGVFAEGLGAMFRYYKAARTAAAETRQATMTPGEVGAVAAKDATRQAAVADLVNPLKPGALDGLGDPNGPLVSSRTTTTITKNGVVQTSVVKTGAELPAASVAPTNPIPPEILSGLGVKITHAPTPFVTPTTTAADRAAPRLAAAGARVDSGALDNVLQMVKDRQAVAAFPTKDAMGELLDMARNGAGVEPASKFRRYPLLGLLKDKGGVAPGSPLAQELTRRGVTAKSMPGLYRRGGRTAFDNVPASEEGLTHLADPNSGYVDPNLFFDAVDEELHGKVTLPPDVQEKQSTWEMLVRESNRFRGHVENLGGDFATMNNQQLKDVIATAQAERARVADLNATPAATSAAEFQGTAIDENVAPPPIEPAGTAPVTGKVFINHARINTPDDVHALIQTMADSDAEAIAVKTRGVVSNQQTIKESAAEFQNLEDLIGRRPGPMSAAEAVASRKVLTASGEQLLGLAAKAGADGATPADLFAFRRAMQVHYAIQSEVIAARTETARALQSWAIPAGSDKMRADAIAEMLGQGGGQDTVTMAKMLGTLANNPSGLNQFVQQSLRGKVKDALFEAWINGLLTSPKTHVVNVLSNTLTTFWQIPERFLAAGISNAFQGGEIKMGEAAASAFAMARGVRDGAALVSRGGNDPSVAHLFEAFSKQERPYGTAISSGAFDVASDSPLGFGLDMLGKLIRTPGAALDAEDKFFKAVNYRMELHALAYRQASEEGLEGKQLAQRMADIAANPPENIKLEAIDRAHINTFTKKLGPTGQAFTSLVNKVPGARLVVPFIRTPANILKFTFARTPLAFASSAVRADISAGGARAAQAYARVSMGSMVMLGFGSLAAEGVLTGAGPLGSPDETRPLRSNMLRTGWQPYSVNIGGRWWRYNRLEPIGMLVGMSADIAEVLGHIGDEEATQVVAAAAVAFAQNMASKTWAQGAFDALAAIDPNNPDSDPGKWLQGQAVGTIPFSGFLRNLDQAVDPVLREPRTTQDDPFAQQYLGDLPKPVAEFLNVTINQYRKSIPGLSKDLPPRRDLWGNPISTASGLGWVYDFLSPVGGTAQTNDHVDQMMIENRIKTSLPERAIGGVKLTGDEYSAYVQMAGQPAKKYLDKLVNSAGFKRLSDGPDGAKALVVNSVITKFRKSAADQMLVRFPQVRQRWIANKQQQAQQLQIGAQ